MEKRKVMVNIDSLYAAFSTVEERYQEQKAETNPFESDSHRIDGALEVLHEMKEWLQKQKRDAIGG